MEERIGLLWLEVDGVRVQKVLILIVMEERIGYCHSIVKVGEFSSLNPYCNGRKNRILILV